MLLELFLIGLAITLGPVHNTAFILLLSSQRGVRNGLAFILAWLATLVALIAVVVLLTGGKPPKHHTAPSTAALAVKLALGTGMVLFAEHRRRRRRSGAVRTRPRKTPKWQARLDRVTPATAAALGLLLLPWGATAAGAATVVNAHVSSAASYTALVGYCLLATSSLLAMELYATWSPEAAKRRLNALREWINGHQEQVLVTLALFLGLFLMARSIYGLVG
ncbi:GAP family protein [Actinacidiphila rubida]|uniref:Sap, sulfolipid-1-addressing protein n=1 Tax=Actinacidiphila rubida TaxID=310780 RepID=A0A1H8DCH2_9ACTN|nr:GAP family protein [Actinacidiphila rubida]SEN04187.1 Sap, sulfolipid-1-addressing protein [Actinacidiphila rubida]